MNDYEWSSFWFGVILCGLAETFFTPLPVQPRAMEWATKVCETNGGLNYLRPETYLVYNNKAVCKNGAEFYMRKNADE